MTPGIFGDQMGKPAAAFRATYSEWKLVKTRGVVQVIFEVPLAEHDTAYQALGGMPDPAKERWFGIARLQQPKEVVQDSSLDNARPASEWPPVRAPMTVEELDKAQFGKVLHERPRPRPVAPEKRLTQQAGIMCADPVFQKFLKENAMMGVSGPPDDVRAATAVRLICGVTTRADIIWGTPAGDKWDELVSKFTAWKMAA